MFTSKKLIEKGLKEPKGRSYCPFSKTYCKLWDLGDFYFKINKKGNLIVFHNVSGEIIKVIKDEKVLDAFIVFAVS